MASTAPTSSAFFSPASTSHGGSTPVPSSPPPVQDVGIRSTNFAARKRALNHLINTLSSLGARADIELPQIAVIGNQSAGKSSLVEAISQIRVPRDSKTCTRCPFEIRLLQSDQPWSCVVSLRITTTHDGVSKASEDMFGPTITDPDEVEDRLRRAQVAVLNPTLKSSIYLDEELELVGGTNGVAFSHDVVCVTISGPELTDLTFVDLPGLVSSLSRDVTESVERLIESYIKGKALILLTLPMKEEIETQKAALLARESDPRGFRTIGVLTKPDTLEKGAENDWMDTFRGDLNQLSRGYYITKQPSPHERTLGWSFAEARDSENEFFAKPPWNAFGVRDQARFGTGALTAALSDHLCELIQSELPRLEKELVALEKRTREDLRSLPAPPSSDPSTELLQICTALNMDIEKLIKGTNGTATLWKQTREVYTSFMNDVLQAIPFFSTREEGDMEYDNGSTKDQLPQIIYLDSIRSIIADCTTSELPGIIPSTALTALLAPPLDSWKALVEITFENIRPIASDLIGKLVSQRFGVYEQNGLRDKVMETVAQQIDIYFEKTMAFLRALISIDDLPWTQNNHYYIDATTKYLAQMRASRMEADHPTVDDPHQLTIALAALASLGFEDVNKETLKRLHDADEWDAEMQLAARARAYLKLAYKRVIDTIPQSIQQEFLHPLPEAILRGLIDKLDIYDPEQSEFYLREHPGTTRVRRELEERMKRVEGEKAAFKKFQRGCKA